MNSPSAGIICTSNMTMTNDVRPRNLNRDTASAARNAKSSAIKTVASVTNRLIPRACMNPASSKSRR